MIENGLINPGDSIERQNEKLMKISEVLMRRVEQVTDDGGAAYAQFQRSVLLEDQVHERTVELEKALALLNTSNVKLGEARKAAEHARSDLANAIETIQEGFALFSSDDNLVLCNSRFGMHMPDLKAWLAPGITFNAYVEKVSNSPYLSLPPDETPENWAFVRKSKHRDDHVVFNVCMTHDRWVQVSEHRTTDKQTVIMQTDVTDIMRLGREERGKMLDEHAQLIHATLDHINQGVCIFDHRHRLVGWNQRVASLLSIKHAQFQLGADFDFLYRRLQNDLTIHGQNNVHDISEWVQSTTRRPPLRFEIRHKSKRALDVFAQEMPDKGFVISFTDVTAERDAALKLQTANDTLENRVAARTRELEGALANAERANASKSRFVAAASHDILQPLSAAKLYVSSMSEEPLEARQHEILLKAQNALSSVEDIIGALLDISQLESGNAPVNVSEVQLGGVLRQLHDEFAPLAALKGLKLNVRQGEYLIKTDPGYLRRILQNLIGNAVRYTQTGKVLVGTRRQDATLRIEVWDTGPGIPEGELDNIYKEFHRLAPTSSANEGLGLGLAIVERACALLDLPLKVQSQVGRGTVFSVTVPLTTQRHDISHGQTGDMQYIPDQVGLVVLLIENDLDMRRALRLLLEKWGVQVLDVGSGAEAIALLDEIELTPDAMLVDFQLSEVETGLDVIPEILARFGDIPARIVTASRSPEVNAQCRNFGVSVMHKPIDPLAIRLFLSTLDTS